MTGINTTSNTTAVNMIGTINSNNWGSAQTDFRQGMTSFKNNDIKSAIDHFNSAVNSLTNSSSTAGVIRMTQAINAVLCLSTIFI